VRLAAGALNNNDSCSEELRDCRGTKFTFHFPFQCGYPHGFVVAVQTIAVERIKRATPICRRHSRSLVFRQFLCCQAFFGISCTFVIAPIDATNTSLRLLLTTQRFVWISCTQSRHEYLLYYHGQDPRPGGLGEDMRYLYQYKCGAIARRVVSRHSHVQLVCIRCGRSQFVFLYCRGIRSIELPSFNPVTPLPLGPTTMDE
jgi:hypothetical protein